METLSTSLNISLIEAGHRTLREDHREKKNTAQVLAAHPATVSGWSRVRLKQGPVRSGAAKAQPSVLHASALLHGFQKEFTSVITAALLRPGRERRARQGFCFTDEKMKFKVHPASHNRGWLK